MQRILSARLPDFIGQPVRLAGWIHRRRLLKSVAFLILRDAAGLAQVVVTDPAVRAQLEHLPEETVVAVVGTATAQPTAPGGVEVTGPTITPLSDPAAPVPFDLYRPDLRANLPTILDHAPVALRHPKLAATHRIAAAAVAGFRKTLTTMGFVEIHTPKIVGTATESGANVFALDYFGRRAYLAQSPQLYKQIMVGVFERVFEVGPVFRAEPSDTARHLAAYTSLDAELGFVDDHRDVIAVCHATVAGTLAQTLAEAMAGMAFAQLCRPGAPVVFGSFASSISMQSGAPTFGPLRSSFTSAERSDKSSTNAVRRRGPEAVSSDAQLRPASPSAFSSAAPRSLSALACMRAGISSEKSSRIRSAMKGSSQKLQACTAY